MNARDTFTLDDLGIITVNIPRCSIITAKKMFGSDFKPFSIIYDDQGFAKTAGKEMVLDVHLGNSAPDENSDWRISTAREAVLIALYLSKCKAEKLLARTITTSCVFQVSSHLPTKPLFVFIQMNDDGLSLGLKNAKNNSMESLHFWVK